MPEPNSSAIPASRKTFEIGGFFANGANVCKYGELSEVATCKQSLQVQIEGNRSVKRNVKYYNLDMILAMERLALEEYAKFHARRLKAPDQIHGEDSIVDDLNDAAKSPK